MQGRLLWKLELTYIVVLLAVVVSMDFYTGRILRQQALDEANQRLASLHTLAAADFPADSNTFQAWASNVAQSGARVTIVARDGAVLADSAQDPQAMENHGSRPEIIAGWSAGEGRAVRYSDTVHREMVYWARAVRLSGGEALMLRLAAPLADIEAAQAAIRRRLWAASAGVLVVGALLSLMFSRAFTRRVEKLKQFAEGVAAGKFEHLPAEREGDELSALTRSLNATAEQLESTLNTLREERDRAQAILRSMVEAVAVVDANERLRFANRAFTEMLGTEGTQAENRPLVEVVRQPELLRLIRQALRDKRVVSGEVEIPQLENPSRMANFGATAGPVAYESGSGAVLVLHDITELRRLERVRRDFVANVSHEFRTPLTAIQGFAETLLSGALEDKENSRRFLGIIRDHAVRLGRLTEDLLRLSQIEARQLHLEFRPINLKSLIAGCVETAHFEAAQKGITVEIRGSDGLPTVQADSSMLREAVQNLLDNAVRYTPNGGRVTVETSARGNEIHIAVCDTGIGIPLDEQQRIFERFYRVDPGRSRELGGTGLGLSIAKHLVESHGGRIEVESEVGKGSTFRIILPAT
jgi:two-component system phosphate regulon sensor histidine kinase PhoR